ncbi:restriction endonuclease subunit S [Vibrio vulnificus]|uniref:restriction endonuclease subunit S n=1 Tax=Vibrio vulnificus TaxID=672 RepID=UPI001CDB50F1|nr:restriction endonuclease subunit S [Vibrio vulnificus]MCA3893797.1 restriction endonuclease subunit S [Vibrio vulnificus]MCA3907509.1 restriction endonuclease subunit S [Vibrio vulnificus]
MVPNGWSKQQISDICTLQNGNSFKPHQWDTKGLPIIRIQNLNGSENFNYYSGEVNEKWLVETGQLLFSWAGTKGVSFGPFIWKKERGVLNQHIYKVYAQDQVDQDWLYESLRWVTNKIEAQAHGFKATLLHVQKKDIDNQPILVPPLPEQRKIAQILSTWDRGIATTEKLIDASKQQKKALMQQLLTGKKRLVDPETGKAFEGEWEDTHLSNITSIKKGKALSAKNLVAGSYPVIAGGKSSPYSHVDFTHENVITVSASGAYAGYVSYHPYKIWASDCSVVTAKPANYLGFIFQWLQLNQIRIYSMQSGGAQPHIYPKDLEVMKLRVPKIEEQQKIASVLTAADKEIELLVAKLAHLKQEKNALMQQLLTGKRRVSLSS